MTEALPPIEGFDDPDYDPFDDDRLNWGNELNPYARLAELRRRAPVVEGEYRTLFGMQGDVTRPPNVRTFMVLGYDEAAEALASPETFSNEFYLSHIQPTFGRSLTVMDAPEHGRYRRIFQKAFAPNVVRHWGDGLVQPVIDELIGRFARDGRAELVSQFTRLYPFEIIYRQLDLPRADVATFHKLGMSLTSFAVDPSKGREASVKLGRYLERLIERRRRGRGNDLVSMLVQAEDEGETLPVEILVSFLRQLMNAAGDTTYRSTSTMMAALLTHPEQLAALRADRSLIAGAIEELLRWDGPVGLQGRTATRDTVLGGVTIPKGSIVEVMAMAADRDDKAFPDPDRFDIRRPNLRHLAFASGPHLCLGMHLARVEMTRAVQALLDRLPNLRLDPERPAPEVRGIWMRFPDHIHVRFDPAGG